MKKINLGCGWRDFGKDWIHIDGGDYPHLDSNDIINLPYGKDTIGLIYASHVLEYFDRLEAIDVLTEWKRVLKKGGTLQLAVPDFEAMVLMYNNKLPLDMFEGTMYGRMFMGNDKIYHKTIYDYESLKGLLISMGFIHIKFFDSKYDDYSQATRPKINGKKIPISLNVECTKK